MTLTDRIYLVVHGLLAALVFARHDDIAHWPLYAAWNLAAIAAIVCLSSKRQDSSVWAFAHDWLPVVFFISVFEEVSVLSLTLRGGWQNSILVRGEAALFVVPPGEWLRRFVNPWLTELLDFGYFTFYPLYPALAGVFWAWRKRPQFAGAFRRLTDSLSVGYVVCYVTYLLFPTRSPSHDLGLDPTSSLRSTGPFHLLVRLIQGHAGVHGNAFPSAHIMLAVVVLCFTFWYFRRFVLPLLVCVLLMCLASVHDGYHYVIDVVAGAVLGATVGGLFLRPVSKLHGQL